MRILYVEDEKFLAEAVKHNLEKNKIDVDLIFDGEEGMNMAMLDIYDLVILDIMLPKCSGLDILKRMREKKVETPVIVLSALSEVEDKVNGLNLGADDYLAKPFKTAELLARENVQIAIDFDNRKADADKYLKIVGLSEEESGRLIGRLSSGQQQRVAIARALASNSPIIVADEPTGNLDEDTEAKIIELFKDLAYKQNKIVIIVTHSKRVASHADKVLKLRRGELREI